MINNTLQYSILILFVIQQYYISKKNKKAWFIGIFYLCAIITWLYINNQLFKSYGITISVVISFIMCIINLKKW